MGSYVYWQYAMIKPTLPCRNDGYDYYSKVSFLIQFYVKQLSIFEVLSDLLLLSFGLTHIVGITFSAKSSGVILQILVHAGDSIGFSSVQIVTIITHAFGIVLAVLVGTFIDYFGLLLRKLIHNMIDIQLFDQIGILLHQRVIHLDCFIFRRLACPIL